MIPEQGQSEDGRTIELQIDGRQLLIVVVGIVLLCAVFFHFGRRVGRSEAGTEGLAGVTEKPLDSSEDAAADLTFFDRVTEERGSTSLPPVASGSARRVATDGNSPRDAVGAVTSPPAPASTGAAQRSVAAVAPVAPAGGGIEIQVAVLSERARAEALASRLRSKGYLAQVSSSSSSGRTVWRVRVGGYPSREAARSVAARLERDENLKTWIPEGR